MPGVQITSVPAASTSRRTISVPVSFERRAHDLCATLRQKPQISNFNDRLKAIFADGEMTKDEFADLLDLNVTGGVTEEFWLLFTGGKQTISSIEDFVACLENCRESLRMTGDTLVTISHRKDIIAVNRAQLGRMLRNMGLTLAHLDTGNLQLRSLLERAKALGGDSGKTGFENLSDKTWELLAFGLFVNFTSTIFKEMRYKDINKFDFSDPWVMERFGELFEKYVKNEDGLPTEKEIDTLLEFQKKVKKFREWAQKKGIANRVYLSQFDINTYRSVLDNILGNYEKMGPDEVLRQLNNPAYRRTTSIPGTTLPLSSGAPRGVSPARGERHLDNPLGMSIPGRP